MAQHELSEFLSGEWKSYLAEATSVWRNQRYAPESIATRARWIRRFHQGIGGPLRSLAGLTAAQVIHLVKRQPGDDGGAWQSRVRVVRGALRAWSQFLDSVRVKVPPWISCKGPADRDPLLREYAAYRQRWRPVIASTLREEQRTTPYASCARAQLETARRLMACVRVRRRAGIPA